MFFCRDVQKAATHIAKKAVDLDIVPGRSPISVAAAAIYMASQASDDKRTQREIADIAGSYPHRIILFDPFFPTQFEIAFLLSSFLSILSKTRIIVLSHFITF